MSVQTDRAGQRLFVTLLEHSQVVPPTANADLHRMLEAQDAERRRLSLELHDEFGQTLGALEVGLARIEGIATDQGVRESSLRLRALVRGAAQDLRRLAHGLHPRVLEDYGLRPALERLISDTRSFSGVRVLLAVDECGMPQAHGLAVYRVVQEALSNAVRHSGASAVRIEVVRTGSRVTGSVEDDGCGFAVEQMSLNGLGVRGMRERIEQLGGLFEIVSRVREGTTVSFELELPPGEEHPD